uniref:BTB domain-containing protein n=1 Tax=Anopheles epiroticus TaxID=199890 RepID=A0A182P614_9DIPT
MFSSWINPSAPDVILEVGPHPCSTRYAAHAALLATHSGYLRAALRTQEQHASTVTPLRRVLHQHSNGTAISVPSDVCTLPATATTSMLYLPNVSPEQFSPLLSYMYTGYLDLTMENIFGVLLATHLLHMPRALELCRTFLASSASATNASITCTTLSEPSQRNIFASTIDLTVANGASKLVRPIASKPMATIGLNFIAPPTASQINLLPSAPFRSLGSTAMDISIEHPKAEMPHDTHSSSQSPISVTRFEEETRSSITPQNSSLVESDVNNINNDYKCNENISKPEDHKHTDHTNTEISGTFDNENRTNKCNAKTGFAKRQKAQQEVINDSANGVIIDIASCDGPVRFRRVLNVMYGLNTNNRISDGADSSLAVATDFTEAENNAKKRKSRSLRYASSFHQQMARNISNTGKLSYESSSSSSSNSSCLKYQRQQTQLPSVAASVLTVPQDQEQKDENVHEDVTPHSEATNDTEGNSNYTCVYCKHTFKSHYCYQKHAKRHLIPLCLDSTTSCSVSTINNVSQTAGSPRSYNARRRAQPNPNGNAIRSREVKPLDMNVQYYPCKTCGSKFPSYYFVHKHRKLCHTEEDEDTPNASASTSRITSDHNSKSFEDALQTEHEEITPDLLI